MNLIKTITIFSLFFSAHSFAEDASNHLHQAPSIPVKKFVADQNLKKRMNIVLETMMALHKNESTNVKKEYLTEIGGKIERTVQDIFKSCKLAPDADAAIHPILAEILDGAAMLKRGLSKDGSKKIHEAFLKYESYFDHADWKHN